MTTLPTDSTLTTVVKNDWTWLKGHLALLLAVAVLVFIGVFGIENVIAKRDKEKSVETQQILAAQAAQTQLILSKLTQDEQNWSAENAQDKQIIATLAQTIAKRDAATKQQQKIDTSLSATEAADRLAQQVAAKPGEVTAQGDSVLMDLPVSRQVVQLVDSLPTVQADLTDTQGQLAAETKIATNLQADVDSQKLLVTSLQTQNTDQTKACQAQVKDLKAQARKGKAKWFVIGFISGFVARLAGV